TQPWGGDLRADLPVSGHTGTLAGRLGGPETAGRVQAKTGTILEGAALSGYATTVGGRDVTFSVIGNGPGPAAITGAIDAVVTAVVGWDG
ncbi:MAG: D-alanyl-D-alanine carboxypeptidase, partial [Actinomycetota bacterium]